MCTGFILKAPSTWDLNSQNPFTSLSLKPNSFKEFGIFANFNSSSIELITAKLFFSLVMFFSNPFPLSFILSNKISGSACKYIMRSGLGIVMFRAWNIFVYNSNSFLDNTVFANSLSLLIK